MAFPVGISQKLLQAGYKEEPFDNIIATPMDQGLPKLRRKYSGKARTITGQLWIQGNAEYADFMAWWYAEAQEGTAYFTFDDQHGGTMEVRMSKLSFSARGGAGFLASVELEEKPHA